MKTLLSLIAVTALAGAVNVSAKTIKFPEKNPAFSFTLPDDWTTKPDDKGNLDCTAGDGSKFSFSIVDAKGAKEASSEAEVKAYLPKLAKTMGDGAKIGDLKVHDAQEMTNPNKIKLMGLNATGQTSGVDMVISLAAFAPKEDHYFIMMAAEPAEIDKAHDPAMMEIIKSIKRVNSKDSDDDDDDE